MAGGSFQLSSPETQTIGSSTTFEPSSSTENEMPFTSQTIDFQAADKANDPDPMSWSPAASAIPVGLMFPDLNGNARLDLMWSIPAQV